MNVEQVMQAIACRDDGGMETLFRGFPQYVQNEGRVRAISNVCGKEMSQDVLKYPGLAIDHCGDPTQIPKLFSLFTEDICSNTQIAISTIEKLGADKNFKTMLEIYKAMDSICDLFKYFSQEVRSTPETKIAVIKALCEVTLADDVLVNASTAQVALSNISKRTCIPFMFGLLSKDVQKETRVHAILQLLTDIYPTGCPNLASAADLVAGLEFKELVETALMACKNSVTPETFANLALHMFPKEVLAEPRLWEAIQKMGIEPEQLAVVLQDGGFLPKKVDDKVMLKKLDENTWCVVGVEGLVTKYSYGVSPVCGNEYKSNGIYFRKGKNMEDKKNGGVEVGNCIHGEDHGQWIYVEELRTNPDILRAMVTQIASDDNPERCEFEVECNSATGALFFHSGEFSKDPSGSWVVLKTTGPFFSIWNSACPPDLEVISGDCITEVVAVTAETQARNMQLEFANSDGDRNVFKLENGTLNAVTYGPDGTIKVAFNSIQDLKVEGNILSWDHRGVVMSASFPPENKGIITELLDAFYGGNVDAFSLYDLEFPNWPGRSWNAFDLEDAVTHPPEGWKYRIVDDDGHRPFKVGTTVEIQTQCGEWECIVKKVEKTRLPGDVAVGDKVYSKTSLKVGTVKGIGRAIENNPPRVNVQFEEFESVNMLPEQFFKVPQIVVGDYVEVISEKRCFFVVKCQNGQPIVEEGGTVRIPMVYKPYDFKKMHVQKVRIQKGNEQVAETAHTESEDQLDLFNKRIDALLTSKDHCSGRDDIAGIISKLPATANIKFTKLQQLAKSLPEGDKTRKLIERELKEKRVMEFTRLKKARRLLWRAILCLSAFFMFVFPVEVCIDQANESGIMEMIDQAHWTNISFEKLAARKSNSSFPYMEIIASTEFDNVAFEVSDTCPVRIPQPFEITGVVEAMKIVFVTTAFGFTARDLLYKKSDSVTDWKKPYALFGVTVYQVVMIPLTLFLAVKAWEKDIQSEGTGILSKYTCFYAILNLCPFQANSTMFLLQFLFINQITADSKVQGWLHKKKGLRRFWPLGRPSEVTRELTTPLWTPLKDQVEGTMHARKVLSKWYIFLLTFVPYYVIEIPFIVTHKSRALILFSPFIFVVIFITGLMLVVANIDFIIDLKNCRTTLKIIVAEIEQAGYIPILPILWGLTVTNNILTLAPIYYDNSKGGFYGWFASGMSVISERKFLLYIISLKASAMHTQTRARQSFITLLYQIF